MAGWIDTVSLPPAPQTLGYLVVLAGFVMAYLMHRASEGAGHEEVFAATPGSSVPLGADAGGLVNNPLVGRRRRLLHEHHDDPARGRVAELHAMVGFVVLGMVTLQVRCFSRKCCLLLAPECCCLVVPCRSQAGKKAPSGRL